jgi:microsomal dipeptidase-like Zn-dependent dipeptidase
MMQIARLQIIQEEKETKKSKDAIEETWNHILENYRSWDSKDVTPLYLTHRGIYNDISLVVSSKSPDSFTEYLLKNLKQMDKISDVWMFNLIKPELFSPPENISQNLKRYSIALRVHPKEAKSIYERLSKIEPTPEVIITYITFTYHKRNDLLISVLSGNRHSVEDFTRDYIEGIKGIVSSEVIPLVKSKNLATAEEWERYCGQYFKAREGTKEDQDIYERWYSEGFE